MTPRENLLSMYRRNGYKYAPVFLYMCPSLLEHYESIAGDTDFAEYFDYPGGFALGHVPHPKVKGYGELAQKPDWSAYYCEPLKVGTSFDDFGIAHEPGSEAAKHMTRMHHPMAGFDSLEQIQTYPLVDFDFEDITHIKQAVDILHGKGMAAAASMQCTIWERSWYLRDMTVLMMDMVEDDPKAHCILDTITEQSCKRAAAFAAAGTDIIELGDDVGMQQSLMMSRDMYCTWLKPRLAKVVAAAKAVNPDVLIFYHSCGYVEPLIDDLIEAGVEIFNPVQPECMDFAEIHSRYGERISFNGTIGTQTTMPFGTVAEVKAEVFRNLELAGSDGGLFCCPTHLLEPEVPWENIKAYVEACKEFSL